MSEAVNFKDVLAAAIRIKNLVRCTPVVNSSQFDKLLGASVYFKCENLQRTGSFKMRGASNAVWALDSKTAASGVATHSSGNHGAALAAAAKARGIPCSIVVPKNASPAKIANMRALGGELIMCEPGLRNRENGLQALIQNTNAVPVHPYDNAAVIAGQGTATLELLQDESQLDVLLVPVGGGGLVSGALLVVKTLSPGTQVIGVEPSGADDARQSLASGKHVILDNPTTIADGLRASLGKTNFAIIRQHIDEIITVTDDEIVSAMDTFSHHLKMKIEPSSATVVAAMLGGQLDLKGKRVGAIISGGNVTAE